MTPIWWLLVFFPALIALYFLKLKRRDVVISSTLLWKRSIEDLRVNAPFQRLRKSWLLLLQLLVLAGLIAAAWRPRISGGLTGGRTLIVLVDNSASMSAREKDGTRLDLAKRDALALVSGLSGSDRMALLTFSSRTAVVEPLTADKTLLESRIRGIEATELPTSLEQALLVARSMSETLIDSEVRVFGDGCYGDLSTLPPDAKRMKIELTAESTPLENVGITEMDVRTSFEGKSKTEVFALIESSLREASRLVVSFSVNGELKDAREVDIAATGTTPVVFDATAAGPGIASVSIDSKDALLADNQAWAQIDPPRTVRVLVTGKANPWLDLVLRSSGGMSHRRITEEEYAKLLAAGPPEDVSKKLEADVLILDRVTPPSSGPAGGPPKLSEPPLPAIFIACEPLLPRDALEPGKKKLPVVVDWDRTHPVNRFLVFTDLYIEESSVFRPRGELRSLVDSDAGSLIATLRFYPPGRRSIPALLIGFDILKSNWPLGHYSFPIFFSNAIAWLGGSAAGAGSARSRTGDALVYDPAATGQPTPASVEFRSPSGKRIAAARESAGSFVLGVAEEAGVYEVVADGATSARLPVSLLSSSESRLAPSRVVDFGDFQVDVKPSPEKGAKDLWKWCALAALLVCIVEWHVYNRRLAG
jgi:hypothetical protein